VYLFTFGNSNADSCTLRQKRNTTMTSKISFNALNQEQLKYNTNL